MTVAGDKASSWSNRREDRAYLAYNSKSWSIILEKIRQELKTSVRSHPQSRAKGTEMLPCLLLYSSTVQSPYLGNSAANSGLALHSCDRQQSRQSPQKRPQTNLIYTISKLRVYSKLILGYEKFTHKNDGLESEIAT